MSADRRNWMAWASLAVLAACSPSGGTSTTATTVALTPTPAQAPTPASSPTPTPTPTPAPTAVQVATTLNLAALANYAAPTLPAYYDNTVAALDNTPANNAVTDRVATLGRVLFYDKQLSVNNTIACASCHQQAFGFSDPRQFSTGFSGTAFTSAHSMRLGNVRYYAPGSMFWDKRTASVELQASQPIINAVEMGWTTSAGGIDALVARLNAIAYYQELFTFAFGTATVTEARIQQALAQFERAMISANSKFDIGYALVFNPGAPNRGLNTDFPNFTAQENRGKTIFMTGAGGCSACHQAPTFALAANSRSNGLDAGETRIFKSPSLKSVGLGGPYMHDGRFSTIEQVVEFYDNGIQDGPALDNRLQQGGVPRRLNLSAADKAALAAFLRTLDDTSLTTDARFTNPFR